MSQEILDMLKEARKTAYQSYQDQFEEIPATMPGAGELMEKLLDERDLVDAEFAKRIDALQSK